jgi:serine/threonine protein kinase
MRFCTADFNEPEALPIIEKVDINDLQKGYFSDQEGDSCEETVEAVNFQLIHKIGAGAYGSVFLVRRKSTSDLYALKLVENRSTEKGRLESLRMEHRVFKLMTGEHMVKAAFSFPVGGYHAFVMEYMPGGSLADLLEKQVYLSEALARFYIGEIIMALESLHSRKIIHRDIKP